LFLSIFRLSTTGEKEKKNKTQKPKKQHQTKKGLFSNNCNRKARMLVVGNTMQ